MGYPQAIPNIPGSLGSPRIHFFSLAQPSPAHPCLAQPCLAQPSQLVAETKPTCGRNSPNGPPRLGLSAYIPRFLRGLPFQRHAWVRERKRAGFLSPLNNFPLRDRPESASVSERASCLYIYTVYTVWDISTTDGSNICSFVMFLYAFLPICSSFRGVICRSGSAVYAKKYSG